MKIYKKVLNLIITGIPSILLLKKLWYDYFESFKPYYNWNTFNTQRVWRPLYGTYVLNLIITGIPSILRSEIQRGVATTVLNLIITGIPSIQKDEYRRNSLKEF